MLFSFTASCIAGYLVNSAVIDTVHWRHVWLFLALAWISDDDNRQRLATQLSGTAAPLHSLAGREESAQKRSPRYRLP